MKVPPQALPGTQILMECSNTLVSIGDTRIPTSGVPESLRKLQEHAGPLLIKEPTVVLEESGLIIGVSLARDRTAVIVTLIQADFAASDWRAWLLSMTPSGLAMLLGTRVSDITLRIIEHPCVNGPDTSPGGANNPPLKD